MPKNIYRQSSLARKRLFDKSSGNGNGNGARSKKFLGCIIVILLTMLLTMSTSLFSKASLRNGTTTTGNGAGIDYHEDGHEDGHNDHNEEEEEDKKLYYDQNHNSKDKKPKLQSCNFRTYKPKRYYKLDDSKREDFLSDADYIRGKLPFVLNPRSKMNTSDIITNGDGNDNGESDSGSSDSPSTHPLMPKKLCIDTSEWEKDIQDGFWPFSDGQNPSIVSLSSNVYDLDQPKPRIDPITIEPLKHLYDEEIHDHDHNINKLYVGLLLFGDSQCRWNLSSEELAERKFSPLDHPPSKRSMVILYSAKMDVITSTVLKLERDADWGGKRKNVKKKENGDGSFEKEIVELDDARLFFHNGQLHVLYRNGPFYGYEMQVQNPIHFETVNGNKLEAFIKASETFTVCCGRNIAFISELPIMTNSLEGNEKEQTEGQNENNTNKNRVDELLALTWIDPVTTEVITPPVASITSTSRRLLHDGGNVVNNEQGPEENNNKISSDKNVIDLMPVKEDVRRFLKGKKKSHIHGTNGYMLPLHSSYELMGIAHFHRPEGRDSSEYAKHGHHYTHAFFTIQLSSETNKYVLKRLSNEFIFMAPSSEDDQTGDVIQFTSGLDLIGSDKNGKLLISYGINDCEAASFFIGMEEVQNLLIDVEEGHEVLNLMEELSEI